MRLLSHEEVPGISNDEKMKDAKKADLRKVADVIKYIIYLVYIAHLLSFYTRIVN